MQYSAERPAACDDLKTTESLRRSQQNTNGSYPKPNKSSPRHIYLKSV